MTARLQHADLCLAAATNGPPRWKRTSHAQADASSAKTARDIARTCEFGFRKINGQRVTDSHCGEYEILNSADFSDINEDEPLTYFDIGGMF